MSRGTTRARRAKPNNRPSNFFIAAITIAVLLFLWGFVVMLRRPPKAPVPATTTEIRAVLV